MQNNTGYWWRLFAQAFTLLAAAAGVAMLFLQINDFGAVSYRKAVSRALPSVVSIVGRDAHGMESSIGSGVIISRNGHILTNYHIIAGIPRIEARLRDDESHIAELVGIDPDIDIAVLRVRADSDLPVMDTATGGTPEPGDVVFAMGNPFGLNRSTTMGIVSAIGRDRLGLHGVERFIQTDAAINPGSSGGALADARGRLVGINSALFYRQNGVAPQGIGFAIPAALALRSYGRLTQENAPAAFGAEIRPLSPRLRGEVLGADTEAHAALLAARVWPDSPAHRMGLQTGDVIIKINGGNPHPFIKNDELTQSAARLEILRGGEVLSLHTQRLPAAAPHPAASAPQ